jgi:eukaryotic-like serine/threonine-protein kinase
LRLVDFDSVWIPALQGQAAPTESGHPSYQPHGAMPQSRWGPFMDTFSGLVIYLALTALARDPGLWPKFNNGDNLLFERTDFAPSLGTEIWQDLAGLGDAEVDRIVVKLKECFAPGWSASKSLRDTLRSAWWEQQGAAMKTVTLGTATAETPAAGTGAQTMPLAPPWYAPSVPSQAPPPAGSLPPPPTAPYQSAIAPQATGPLPTVTGKDGAEGDQSWWGAKLQPKATEAKPRTAPAKARTAPARAKSQHGNPVRSALGALLILGAIITFLVLTTHHLAGVGAAVGAILFFAGIGVADTRSSKKKPPGNPPTPPTSGGGTASGT